MKNRFIFNRIVKIGIILLIVAIIFSDLDVTKATSGTCSYHNGFDCTAGPDYDNSAICNDGWADSSEDFYTMSGCVPKCSYSELEALKQKYGVTQEIEKINAITVELANLNNQILALDIEEQAKITALKNNTAGMTQDFYLGSLDRINRDYDTKRAPLINLINTKNTQIEIYQLNINKYANVIDLECKDLGYKEWQKIQQERLSFKITAEEELRRLSCPANSIYTNSICICNDGYSMNGDICITYNQACQNKYGLHSYGDKQHCYCSVSYQFNSEKTSCIPITMTTVTTPTTTTTTTTTTLPSLKKVQTETTVDTETSTVNQEESTNSSLENSVKEEVRENTAQVRFLPRILQAIRNFFLKFLK